MASDSQNSAGVEGDMSKVQVEGKFTTEEPGSSDNDGNERPVRRKLRETKITSVPPSSNPLDASSGESQEGRNNRASSRGRKRSFNEAEVEEVEDEATHRRKRSRSSNVETEIATPSHAENNDTETAAKLMSPKKRSREQHDKDEMKAEGVADEEATKDPAEKGAQAEKPSVEGEPEKKRHRDDSQERDPAPLPSAFANTSAVSPFGSIAAKQAAKEDDSSEKTQATSSSAFAKSSLSAFAGSEQSPFGSLGGGSTESVFKKAPVTTELEKPKAAFAAAAGPSPFASAGGSGFASLGSGFSAFSGGFGSVPKTGGLTSFASPSVSGTLGSTSKAKTFGTLADDQGKEEEQEQADNGPGEFESEKTDERFFEREIETGEKEENTLFSCKAKLFQFAEKEWRERGLGTFKVNVKVTDGKEYKKSARLIMRADGVGRVILNTPVFKGMTVGDPSGNEPKTKLIHLASLENGGRTVPILLRTGSEDHSKELYQVVTDILKEH